MSEQYSLKRPDSHKKRKRLGIGTGSGTGKTSGRGQKGQLSRTGSKHYPHFEGGQMPLQRRIPKRGFKNAGFKKNFQIVNLSMLAKYTENEITPALLQERGAVNDKSGLIKILSDGEITKPLKITADAFSKAAVEKIKKTGGEAIVRTYAERKKVEKNLDK